MSDLNLITLISTTKTLYDCISDQSYDKIKSTVQQFFRINLNTHKSKLIRLWNDTLWNELRIRYEYPFYTHIHSKVTILDIHLGIFFIFTKSKNYKTTMNQNPISTCRELFQRFTLRYLSHSLLKCLESRQRNDIAIRNILVETYGTPVFVEHLRLIFQTQPYNFSRFGTLHSFLGISPTESVDSIFNNKFKLEKGIYALITLDNKRYENRPFRKFFWNVTMKHFGYKVEEYIIDIDPDGSQYSREERLVQALFDIFKHPLYCDFVCKVYPYPVLTNLRSDKKHFIKRKTIKSLFRKHNKDNLEKILFFIVSYGNKEYWANREKNDLFL